MRHISFRIPRRFRLTKLLRVLGASLMVLLLAGVMSTAALYFLLRGESVKDSTLNRTIEADIQRLLGPDYVVDLGRTAVSFDGLLSLASTDVRVLRAVDRQPVSTLGRVAVGIKPLSLLGKEPQIDAVVIENSALDAHLLPLAASAGPPRDLQTVLNGIGRGVERMGAQFSRERFRLVRFANVRITGLALGRREPGDITINDLEVRFRRGSGLHLEGRLSTARSTISIKGRYTSARSGNSSLTLSARGLNLREWLPDPAKIADGPIGSDGRISIDATVAFTPEGHPLNPEIALTMGPSTLRFGREATTPVSDVKLNFYVAAGENSIRLTPSILSAGKFNARLVGDLHPTDPKQGYWGPLAFDLIADPAAGAPTIMGERTEPGAIRIAGTMDRVRKLIDIPVIDFRVGKDRMFGSASFGFNGPTPSIVAALASNGMPVAAIKQFWPFWLAPGAREWTFRNVVGGRATNITVDASIPGGIVGRFRQGAKMVPDDLRVHANFHDVRLDTFGDLPPIRDVSGSFDMAGMKVDAKLDKGSVFLPGDRSVDVTNGSFEVADFGERPTRAEIHVIGEGGLRGIAEIAASRPLDVPRRIDMTPEQFSGQGHVDVVARFPIQRKIKATDVKWNALVETDGAASNRKIQGRSLADAKLHIEATPEQVRVRGTASIDGVPTKIVMNEPMGKSKAKPERIFTSLVDDKARAKMGLSLDPVITGTMEVRFEQDAKGNQTHVIDLKDAELSLPWVGWSKGKGIDATASFKLRSEGGVTHLDDFYLEGEGFSAAGSLAFDKKGVVSADFANISLNEGDILSVQISRVKDHSYRINVEGPRYDARGLINKLIHEGGFGEAQGNTNVVMTATIGSVRGFGDRILNNVSMSYGAVDGWFDNLSLRGTFSSSDYASIVASTSNGQTTFEVDTTDAGAALNMVDVYSHMIGGRMVARLARSNGGPFKGPVNITNFLVKDEPRLRRLVSEPAQVEGGRGADSQKIRAQLQRIDTNQVRFQQGKAVIEKGDGYLRVSDGVLRGTQAGFTFDGLLYDKTNHMSLSGTFMPGMGISRVIGMIPLVGQLLGNGRDSSLIGITFKLSGLAKNPAIEINPISVVAPGVFRKVFEYAN